MPRWMFLKVLPLLETHNSPLTEVKVFPFSSSLVLYLSLSQTLTHSLSLIAEKEQREKLLKYKRT